MGLRVMRQVLILSVCLLSSCAFLYAQDSTYISLTLQRLQQQQVKEDSYFLEGIFPSYISDRPKLKTRKKDNNIFYNGLINYTLRGLEGALSSENKAIVRNIQLQTQQLLPLFKNTKGRDTYNFWRTDTSFRFPYSWWIPLLRGKVTLPDDVDDTVLSLLLQEAADSTAQEVHTLMQQYTNTGDLKTTYRAYADDKAYSTWFGKNFPVVLDISVLCNVLAFVQEYNLPWNSADSATLQLIIKTIQKEDHIKHPAFVSPYYGKTSIILYHLSRLMYVQPIPELETLKPTLEQTAREIIHQSGNLLERMMLNSALMKWGLSPEPLPVTSFESMLRETEQSDLCFFIGNMASYQRQPFKEFLTNRRLLMFYHYCPAYNDALLLEYLVLKRQREKH